jgi:hypothetical protein
MIKGGKQPHQIYDDSLCEPAVEILSNGKSISRLATTLGVCRDTIYEWRDKHPEFALALKRGRDAAQARWEDIGEDGIMGEIKNFSASAWIFTMKNRFRADYAEDKEHKTVNDSIVEQLLLGKKQQNETT